MSTPHARDTASLKYSQQYRRCGKAGCPTCMPPGRGHGPYWYAYWWEQGRVRSRYLGKELPGARPDLQVVPASTTALSLRVRTLGGFAAWRGDDLVPAASWRRRKVAELFKVMLSAPGYRLHVEHLLDILLPDSEPAEASKWLRLTLYRLRKILDAPGAPASHLQRQGALLTLVPTVEGTAEPDWLDAAAFDRTAVEALARRDIGLCREALALYGGEYLPEDRYEDWAGRRREELRSQHVAVLLCLADLSRAAGQPEDVLRCLRTVLAEDPCHEVAARSLMKLFAEEGRLGEALEVHRSLAKALEVDLGQRPANETEAIRKRIAAEAPVALVPLARRTNLPSPLTSFVGRGWERSEVLRMLRTKSGTGRLVTLLGPGGCGKTRLATEVARGLLADFPDGVWLVRLAGLLASDEPDPAQPGQAVAAVLGLSERAGQPLMEVLAGHLATKHLLLVLDNCEHVAAACAALAVALLEASPKLRILTTSQAALGVLGEGAWRVPSLSLPAGDDLPAADLAAYEAVQLFVDRGRAMAPRFVLDDRNAAAVARICRRLDGMPLALELAAARLASLSAEGLAARLDDRLALLTIGNRAAPPRQQTLRATIEWSVGLLSAAERLLLERLSVFAGGWTLDAAETVCAGRDLPKRTVLERLDRLVAKSLVQVDETGDHLRYRMLESIRAFAQELAESTGELEPAKGRHLDWYMALAEVAAPALTGPDQPTWLARLELEHDNLRAALGEARACHRQEEGLRLAGALWRFWATRGYHDEGRRWLEAALVGAGAGYPSARAMALNGAGNLAYQQSDYARAMVLHEEALALRRELGDSRGIAGSLANLGTVAYLQGSYGRAATLYEESLAVLHELRDSWGIAGMLNNLAMIAYQRGDYDRSAALYADSLELWRALDDRESIAGTLGNLGLVVYRQGDYARAASLQEDALALQRELGDKPGMAITLGNLGLVLYRQGDHGRAAALHEESLTLLRELGDKRSIALSQSNLGDVALMRGEYRRATARYQEALTLQREIGDMQGSARSLINLGVVAWMHGDVGHAVTSFQEGLRLSQDIGARDQLAEGLEGLAWLSAATGRSDVAARLGGAADALRTLLGVPLAPALHAGHGTLLSTLSAVLGDQASKAAWTVGQTLPLEEAISMALGS